MELAIKWGPWASLCGAMLWFLMGVVNAKIDKSLELQVVHQTEMTKDLASLGSLLREQNDQQRQMIQQQWIQIGVTQRTCLNTSKTDADRVACAALIAKP